MSTLGPNAKRSFLDYTLRQCRRPSVAIGFFSTTNVSKFFKALFISKAFLKCSQELPAYRLVFDATMPSEPVRVIILLSDTDIHSYETGLLSKELTALSPEKLENFVLFLSPKLIGAVLSNHGHLMNNYKKCTHLLLTSKCDNVALCLKKATDQVRLLPLINTLSPRLTQLECHYDLFKQEHALRPLSLDFCYVEELNSFRKLKDVLNHKVKTLVLRFQRSTDFALGDLCDFKNDALQSLNVVTGIQFMKLLPKLRKFKELCNNMTNLHIIHYVASMESDEIKTKPYDDTLIGKVIGLYEEIQAFKQGCRDLFSSIYMESVAYFDAPHQLLSNDAWTRKIVRDPRFGKAVMGGYDHRVGVNSCAGDHQYFVEFDEVDKLLDMHICIYLQGK